MLKGISTCSTQYVCRVGSTEENSYCLQLDEDLEIIICSEYLPETVESASSAIYSEDWGPGVGLVGVKF
jgi:hypothetical protein